MVTSFCSVDEANTEAGKAPTDRWYRKSTLRRFVIISNWRGGTLEERMCSRSASQCLWINLAAETCCLLSNLCYTIDHMNMSPITIKGRAMQIRTFLFQILFWHFCLQNFQCSNPSCTNTLQSLLGWAALWPLTEIYIYCLKNQWLN